MASSQYLPLRTVAKWEPEARRRGVSKVARSSRGFLAAYKKAGSAKSLPAAWKRKRDAFVARHMAQVKAKGESLFEPDGSPTRRHLALIMWAYSPVASKLKAKPNAAALLNPTLSVKDKRVIDAFLDQEPREGKILDTDGAALRRVGMGAEEVAKWFGQEMVITSSESTKLDDTILRYLRKKHKTGTIKKQVQIEFSDHVLESGEVVGFVRAVLPGRDNPIGKMSWTKLKDGKYFINNVHVFVDFRRKGVGTKMYKAWMEHYSIRLRDLAHTSKTSMGGKFRRAIDPRLPNPYRQRSNPVKSEPAFLSMVKVRKFKPSLTTDQGKQVVKMYFEDLGWRPDRYGNLLHPEKKDERIHFSKQRVQKQAKIQGTWKNIRTWSPADAARQLVIKAAKESGDEAMAQAWEKGKAKKIAAKKAAAKRRSKQALVKEASILAMKRLAAAHPRAVAMAGVGVLLDKDELAKIIKERDKYVTEYTAALEQGEAPNDSAFASVDKPPTAMFGFDVKYTWTEVVDGVEYTVHVEYGSKGEANVTIGSSGTVGMTVDPRYHTVKPAKYQAKGDAQISGRVFFNGDTFLGSLFLIISQAKRAGAGSRVLGLWCRMMAGYGIEAWRVEAVGEEGSAFFKALQNRGALEILGGKGSDLVVRCLDVGTLSRSGVRSNPVGKPTKRKKGEPTYTNLFTMAEMLKKHGGVIPNRVPASDYSHLSRCYKWGYLTQDGKGGFVATPEGEQALSERGLLARDNPVRDPNQDRKEGEFYIPASKMDELAKRIERFDRKSAKLKLKDPIRVEVVGDHYEPERNDFGDPTGRSKHFKVIKFSGKAPTVAGYTFIARVQHTPAGNIVDRAPGAEDVKLPKTLWKAPPTCQHCKLERQRKETFVLRKDSTGKLIRVGRSCLADFLRTEDAAAAVQLWSLIDSVRKLSQEPDEGEEWGGGAFVQDMKDWLSRVVRVIEVYGWVSAGKAYEQDIPSTAAEASWSTFPLRGKVTPEIRKTYEAYQPTKQSDEVAQKALEWAKNIKPKSDYERNIQVIANLDYVPPKSGALAASLVAAFMRAKEKEVEAKKARERAAQKVNEWFGQPGHQYFRKLTLIRRIDIDGQWGMTYLHIFEDDEGRSFKWFASNRPHHPKYEGNYDLMEADGRETPVVQSGDTLWYSFTVKKHDTWDNRKTGILEKNTIITRATPHLEIPKTAKWVDLNTGEIFKTKKAMLAAQGPKSNPVRRPKRSSQVHFIPDPTTGEVMYVVHGNVELR